jgi:predicted phage terminase large subunit-like protein
MSTAKRSSDRERLNAVLRTDFVAFTEKVFHTVVGSNFQDNWHIEALAHALIGCAEGRTKRLAICLPPRHLKSLMASVALPAWILGHDPTAKIICTSYSAELSAALADDCRRVMSSTWYRDLFPGTRKRRGRNADDMITTTAGGVRKATSVGGTLTGLGGDFLIVDDILKAGDAHSESTRTRANDWFDNALYTRLNDPNTGCIIVVGQRLHMNDIFGHIFENEPWEQLQLPLVAEEDEDVPTGPDRVHHRCKGELLQPSRVSEDRVEQIRRRLGEANFAAQYQQNPMPPGGNLIKREWLRVYPGEPDRSMFDMIVQSWDTASSTKAPADFSVCTTWGVTGRDYYLLDVFRGKLAYSRLKARVVAEYDRHRPHRLLIEHADLGRALISDLYAHASIRSVPILPVQDKITRAEAQTFAMSEGRLYLPEDRPWLEDFLKEILAFPNGRNDDQLDSMTQFLKWIGDLEARRARAQRRRNPVRQPGRYHNLGQRSSYVGGLGALWDLFS